MDINIFASIKNFSGNFYIALQIHPINDINGLFLLRYDFCHYSIECVGFLYITGENMATNIQLRALEEDFEVTRKARPVKVNLTTVKSENVDTHKGAFKFFLSMIYFGVLVFFLIKLLF